MTNVLHRDNLLELVPKPKGNKEYVLQNFTTEDLFKQVIKTYNLYKGQTAKLAPKLIGSSIIDTLQNVFGFVKSNIRYHEDPPGEYQYTQSPSHVIYSGVGDCKSYSVLIASLLYNLRIPFFFRFAQYNRSDFQHVYIVAKVNGEQIALDAVMPGFNQQKKPTKIKDIMPEAAILSGTGDEPTKDMRINALLLVRNKVLEDKNLDKNLQYKQNLIQIIDQGVRAVHYDDLYEMERFQWMWLRAHGITELKKNAAIGMAPEKQAALMAAGIPPGTPGAEEAVKLVEDLQKNLLKDVGKQVGEVAKQIFNIVNPANWFGKPQSFDPKWLTMGMVSLWVQAQQNEDSDAKGLFAHFGNFAAQRGWPWSEGAKNQTEAIVDKQNSTSEDWMGRYVRKATEYWNNRCGGNPVALMIAYVKAGPSTSYWPTKFKEYAVGLKGRWGDAKSWSDDDCISYETVWQCMVPDNISKFYSEAETWGKTQQQKGLDEFYGTSSTSKVGTQSKQAVAAVATQQMQSVAAIPATKIIPQEVLNKIPGLSSSATLSEVSTKVPASVVKELPKEVQEAVSELRNTTPMGLDAVKSKESGFGMIGVAVAGAIALGFLMKKN